ncbi:MAG: PhoH family protein [Deltaproteobacteria bacterium]|nr:PhoH family protein [Deltaproteobacteria bacterium]
MAAKNFVLDTNVLLHDPNALFAFSDNNVVIPIYVIEEIDNFKKDLNELGRNARQVSRVLDGFRNASAGNGGLQTGVPLPNGGKLRVLWTDREIPTHLQNSHVVDNRILAVALDLRDKEPEHPAIFVTKDMNLRIRADALAVKTEDYDADKVDIEELYPGWREVFVDKTVVDDVYQKGEAVLSENGLHPSEFLLLRDRENPNHTALGKFVADGHKAMKLAKQVRDGVWGIRPRNKEQSFAFDLLLSDDIKLVTLVGKAGTGKTLLAIAAGLHKTTEEQSYHKLLVSRPIFPLGRDIGYLPGDIEEKLHPWMQPIYDNVELLLGLSRQEKKDGRGYHELIDMGIIEIEPLTYIRGRSIPQQYMIVDEAQNLTPHEVKTIITRVGESTKIVLTGDPYQIDNPYVDSDSNGLSYVVNRFKDEPIAGHITLAKGERSALAELAANIL